MVHAYHCHIGRRRDEIDERVAVDLHAKVRCVCPTPGQAGLTWIVRINERRVRTGDVSLRPALQVEIAPSEIIVEHLRVPNWDPPRVRMLEPLPRMSMVFPWPGVVLPRVSLTYPSSMEIA